MPHDSGRGELSEPRNTEDTMTIPMTMKACVLMAPHHYEVVDRPVPEPGPEDALVRVRACGV